MARTSTGTAAGPTTTTPTTSVRRRGRRSRTVNTGTRLTTSPGDSFASFLTGKLQRAGILPRNVNQGLATEIIESNYQLWQMSHGS